MQHPYDETGAVAGATLLEFAKQDSVITMHSIYSTAKAFDFIERASVLKRINDRLNKIIPAGFSLIVPVYLYYGDATELNAKEKKEFDKKIKKLKKHKKNVSERTVTIYEVAVERRQAVQNIRFVYDGEITKPIGTLSISVGEKIKPHDLGNIDDMFGKAVATDQKTFDAMRRFIEKYDFTQIGRDPLNTRYAILIKNNETDFLLEGYQTSHTFFLRLKKLLTTNELDIAVINALRYY